MAPSLATSSALITVMGILKIRADERFLLCQVACSHEHRSYLAELLREEEIRDIELSYHFF